METLADYFCPKQGAAFAKAIPNLRARIGATPFSPMGSNYGVSGNTFRAYTGWDERPSTVYRQWAEKVCNKLDIKLLERQLETNEGFLAWHSSLARSLQSTWQHKQGGPLSFAHQYKLIDLFVKWLSSHDLSSSKLLEHLVVRANCALDSQTLRKLNECLSMALPVTKPSMGDIHSAYTYAFCQNLIEQFSVSFGGSRLLFDYYAWRKGGSSG
ncbi:MAG: hypothetical protein ACK4FF_09300 [Limnobacter sp.]|uniref:hypothetical protein n=1 Tax=Limnobacter sp. TaxID=2003368 RepID=UPI00391DCD5C